MKAAADEEDAIEKVVPADGKPKKRTYSMDDSRGLSMETPKEETMVSCLLSFNYSVTPLCSHCLALLRNAL